MYDFLEQSGRILRQACEEGQVDPGAAELLSGPARVLIFRLPIKMDDGTSRIFDAYRVRYNDALGPTRDGTRITPKIEMGEVKALGLLMTIKHAAGGIPAGGGKGGIAADPRKLSKRELERLCRTYIRYMLPNGPAYDVPGADIGTDAQAMSWMLDEYEQITGYHAPAAVNDKPPVLGGSLGGYEATGRGVFDVYREAATEIGMDHHEATVAIQGFGQVGSVAASMFHKKRCRVVAVSGSRGGIHCENGLDIPALKAHLADSGALQDFPGTDEITNEELLECRCDVLVPAAVQGVITEDNAERVRPRMLVEAANGPTTVEADAILADNGVTIVPDILANAGSVQVCQMERTQGLSDDYWELEKIDALRSKRLLAAYREALNTAARYELRSARLGAWINAIRRVQEAMQMRGWC